MIHRQDTERAVQLLGQYWRNLQEPEEEQLRAAIGKVTNIFNSDLFQALLDIQEFYEVTLVAALKSTDQKPVASNLFSAEMRRTSTFTSTGLLSPEPHSSSSIGPNGSADVLNSGEVENGETRPVSNII
ncbi:disks large homolog 1-like [Heptranchias perlo]|uniref:disks large homolog 1-like n=1 Tax=Heptranchias perlo TaxID=212740 RepID=UPI00355A3001